MMTDIHGNTHTLNKYPAGSQGSTNLEKNLIQRHNVESTLISTLCAHLYTSLVHLYAFKVNSGKMKLIY